MTLASEQLLLSAYDQYADAIFRFCYAQTGERERAKDATQETFVRAWKYLADGRTISQMRPFLYRTARNILIDRHRQDRTESLDALMEAGFDLASDQQDLVTIAQANQAARMTHRLDPKYREAVVLRYLEDMTPREIAQVTGESENVISVRIHRGMARLKELLASND